MLMSGKFSWDTNIVIALFGGDVNVRQRMRQAAEVFLPCIVLGELYFGAQKSIRVADNINRIDQFAASISILDCDQNTAREYGIIKEALRIKGRPIPDNDIWIAAIAKQHGLVLVTRDAHFNEIDGLTIESW
jgi:tRNA(fMet)-specific endonuclease VapC